MVTCRSSRRGSLATALRALALCLALLAAAAAPRPNTQGNAISCEEMFTATASNPYDVFPPNHDGTPTYRCFPVFPNFAVLCDLRNLWIDAPAVEMARGGDPLETAAMRSSASERPVFPAASIKLYAEKANATALRRPSIKSLLKRSNKEVLAYVEPELQLYAGGHETMPCQRLVSEPVIMVARYEYGNLYHQMTEWYNAFLALKLTKTLNVSARG